MQVQYCVFYNLGNWIVINNYNISVLTVKVIFFLQNTTNQTTNKTKFLQSYHHFKYSPSAPFFKQRFLFPQYSHILESWSLEGVWIGEKNMIFHCTHNDSSLCTRWRLSRIFTWNSEYLITSFFFLYHSAALLSIYIK